MTLHLQMPSQVNNLSPRILVIGVGGAGGNIINSMKESGVEGVEFLNVNTCLLYTSPSPRDNSGSRMPSSA